MADCDCSTNFQVSNISHYAQTSSGAYPTLGLLLMPFFNSVCTVVAGNGRVT